MVRGKGANTISFTLTLMIPIPVRAALVHWQSVGFSLDDTFLFMFCGHLMGALWVNCADRLFFFLFP
ncbi:hypothetical protein B0T19DRAFT_413361 [Cercophora scortea]|uniref:Uncharacterized protein n=1 Tax=Cercophora scortea TaxID=314031 RepID=A0AAE0J7K7_9PEZI|nr:hypothetical protein B0T19DRAFT_413361 [Cercophora scortea]